MSDTKLDVAIISSLTGGLSHYCAHLAGPLSKTTNLKFITYPQIDASGTVVKQITDSFVRRYIKWPRFDIDENNPQSIIGIVDYLKERNVKVVNIHIATTVKRKINYFTTFISYTKKVSNIKFVFTLHDVLPFDDDKKIVRLLEMFYALADHYTVGNEAEKEKLIQYFKINPNKITIIPHGIYDLFDRNLYSQQIARGYLGLPKDKKIILFFGFLREYKGLDYLIKAASILSKQRDDFIVYVASGVKFASKELVESTLTLIQKNKVQDIFEINLNYLETLDIEAVFKASDIVALPYTHASQSGVMMMAFGFKKPVIISDSFYDKNWIDKKAGLVAKTKNPESLAEKINELLSNGKMTSYGQFGFDYAMKHFKWETIANSYHEVFKKTLSR